jgi:hypothetical protein
MNRYFPDRNRTQKSGTGKKKARTGNHWRKATATRAADSISGRVRTNGTDPEPDRLDSGPDPESGSRFMLS